MCYSLLAGCVTFSLPLPCLTKLMMKGTYNVTRFPGCWYLWTTQHYLPVLTGSLSNAALSHLVRTGIYHCIDHGNIGRSQLCFITLA